MNWIVSTRTKLTVSSEPYFVEAYEKGYVALFVIVMDLSLQA